MQRIAAAGGFILLIFMFQASASAQMLIDVYGGMPFTRTADMTVEREAAAEKSTRAIDYNNESYVVGGRIGMWFHWFGVAGDASYFRLDGDSADITVVSTSLLLMMRARLLRNAAVPNGRLQPYLAAGPGYFLTLNSADFRPELSDTVSAFSGSDIGLDTRAGLAWEFARGFALFGEYRFTWFGVAAKDQSGSGGSAGETIDTTLMTHYAIAGLSFRF